MKNGSIRRDETVMDKDHPKQKVFVKHDNEWSGSFEERIRVRGNFESKLLHNHWNEIEKKYNTTAERHARKLVQR